MNIILIYMAMTAGAILGVGVTWVIWQEVVKACERETEAHKRAASQMAREVADLRRQVSDRNKARSSDERDSADWWKN